MTSDYPLKRLRARIRARRVIDLGDQSVHASVIRDILLPPARAGGGHVTSTGVRLRGGVIRGRIELDDAAMPDGSPIPPLDLRQCTLEGGFTGRHGRFSRLSFKGCKFVRPACAQSATIDLAGAEIATDLDLREMKPEGADDVLWVSALAARIDGSIMLDGTVLRAPLKNDPPEPRADALDLSLCEIRGDAFFGKGFDSAGPIKARGVQVDGDIWFIGATVDGKSPRDPSMHFQSARVGGVVVLKGDEENSAERPFVARGEVNFHQLKLGGRFYVGDATIDGSAESDDPSDRVALCLESATIAGGTIGMDGGRPRIEGRIQLAHLEVKSDLEIVQSRLGVEAVGPSETKTVEARGLVARKLTLRDVRPLECEGETDFDPRLNILSVDLSDATLGRLNVEQCRFNGSFEAPALSCSGEVQFDARIGTALNLEGATVGGSIDLSRLRMDDGARLSLKDGNIGRALRLAHRPKPGDAVPAMILAARETILRCLPASSLIETLWWYETDDGTRWLRQHAFLERHGVIRAPDPSGVIRALDRRADTLRRFVRRYGHKVADDASAGEFIRLYCAYGQSESSARWLLTDRCSLPPFLEYVAENGARAPAKHLPEKCLAFAPVPQAAEVTDRFAFDACLLLDDGIGRGRITLVVSGNEFKVSLQRAETVREVEHAPVSEGPYAEHAETVEDAGAEWVMPPVLDGTRQVSQPELKAIAKRLRPHLRSDFSMEGEVDLNGLTCDTLDDQAGRFWGRQRHIDMNHFVYRKATWEPARAPQQQRPEHGRESREEEKQEQEKPTTIERLRRWWSYIQAERVPRWLTWLIGESKGEQLRERTDLWAPWQIRRNWVYQQFSYSRTLLSPARHRVRWREYHPQPFDQAARVARAEGRDEFAIQFEMMRRRIDWDLFDRRARWTLGPFGIFVACAFLAARSGSQDLWSIAGGLVAVWVLMFGWRALKNKPWWMRYLYGLIFVIPVAVVFFFDEWDLRPLDFVVAAAIFTLIRFGAKLSHFGMRSMFGYLRRPARAIYTLLVAFLLGWLGVALANDQGMLIIDATPVATTAGTESDGGADRLVMVSPGGVHTRPFVHNVPCRETISEPLYAIDVLIPLIDLRQEIRCEVGRVHNDFALGAAARVATGTPPRPADRPQGDPLRRLLDAWDRFREQWIALPGKESFWLGLKAIYAMAGWLLVSLSILTFANMNPARNDSG